MWAFRKWWSLNSTPLSEIWLAQDSPKIIDEEKSLRKRKFRKTRDSDINERHFYAHAGMERDITVVLVEEKGVFISYIEISWPSYGPIQCSFSFDVSC